MMCVSSWRLFFKVNRSNLSVESVCFSMLQWSELMNHCRIPCWDISRKFFFFFFPSAYMCPDVAMCKIQAILVVLFYYFSILNAMFSFFSLKHVPCFVILVWLQYSRWVYTIYEDLLFCFDLLVDKKVCPAPNAHIRHQWDAILNSSDLNKTLSDLIFPPQSVTHEVLICPFKSESLYMIGYLENNLFD